MPDSTEPVFDQGEAEETRPDPARKEKLYVGTKLILGRPMDECSFLREQARFVAPNRETREGYRVTYPDGYISWSPKDAFDNSHREVTDAEKALF